MKICVMQAAFPYHGVIESEPKRYLTSYAWTDDGATYETTTNRDEALRLSDYEAEHLERGDLHDILVAAHCHWDTRYIWYFVPVD